MKEKPLKYEFKTLKRVLELLFYSLTFYGQPIEVWIESTEVVLFSEMA